MRLLITGASGLLGRHMLALVRQQGVSVWTLGRTRPLDGPGHGHIACDLLAGDHGAAALRRIAATHWLHLAWSTDPASYQNAALHGAWGKATLALAQSFARAGGRHMVVAGTCAEYDWSHGWCHEDGTPLLGATAYGQAKHATRGRLQDLADARGLRLAWGRIFFLFGQGQAAQRLIPSLASALQGRRAVFPVQALQQRDFVSAPDAARALWVLLQTSADGCYNICSAAPVTIGSLVQTLARQLGRDAAPMLAAAATELHPPALVAGGNGRLRALGWAGAAPLADALAAMLGPTASAQELWHGA